MVKRAYMAAALCILGSNATAQTYNDSPMVDVTAEKRAVYEQDLAECRSLVSNNSQSGKKASTKRGIRSGAMIGAVGGAAAGRASGDNAVRSAGKGAAWGGATGGVVGNVAGDAEAGFDSGYALRRCLEGRGYEVLDYAREDRRIDNGDQGRTR